MLNLMYVVFTYGLAWLMAPAVFRMLAQGRLVQPNYRQEQIPTGAGILLVLATIPTLTLLELWRLAGFTAGVVAVSNSTDSLVLATVVAVLGYALIGLLDDTIGTKEARGLRGHLRSLLGGELTTGMVKALYGGILALFIVTIAPITAPILLAAVLISLTTNAINLCDLRPGRALKAFFFSYGIIVLFTGSSGGPLLCIAAAAAVLMPWDLQGKVMLGDTGANVLGATLGLFLAVHLATWVQALVALGLIGLHIFTEKYSLTKLIAAVKPLQWLDNLGRRK